MVGVTLTLPRSLRDFWAGEPQVALDAATLAEALDEVGRRWPGLSERILDDRGRVRPHIGLFVNATAVMSKEPREVRLAEGDIIRVLPAVSGG